MGQGCLTLVPHWVSKVWLALPNSRQAWQLNLSTFPALLASWRWPMGRGWQMGSAEPGIL